MKSKLLLLDANVVIEAHRLGLWKSLYTQYKISLPSVVLQQEVQFFRSKKALGTTEQIDLKPLIHSGQLSEVAATNDEIEQLSKKFNPNFFEVLGDGELEALALLVSGRIPDTRFSTADGPAIKALGALSMGYSGVSFEGLLSELGQSKNATNLPKHFKKAFFESHLSMGRSESSLLLAK